MEIIRVREKIYQNFNAPSVALGNFDGVHLGHQQIIRKTVESAHAKNRAAVVYTFDPHPRLVLAKVPDVPRITTPRERADILEHLGIDVLILAEFTLEFAAQSPADFVQNILVEELGTRHLFVGENYRFGKGRAGTAGVLKKMASELGFYVHIVPPVMMGDAAVSSSRIRNHLMQGEIREANLLLGREFTIEGRVIHGHHRGKQLGFPTANIKPEIKLHPPEGVYAVYCRVGEMYHQGVMNIGYNPTFKDRRVSYEVHILDFEQDLYGETIRVYLVHRLRAEMKFDGVEALKDQIRKDIGLGREILTTGPKMP
ncbi:MAG TPA: bifunctional riboflavin kinase/FAD synthetase [Desulfomonilaceae bacterium]|nr:bifunctional riboflavin kinase/FAD synthetase [Desulfomonilaceae bacterium]